MIQTFAQQIEAARQRHHEIIADGECALLRVLQAARRDTGQADICARFLLSLYNDPRDQFDLTALRSLDDALFKDCMIVLRMDARACERDDYGYLAFIGEVWEQHAADWRVRDHTKAYRPK